MSTDLAYYSRTWNRESKSGLLLHTYTGIWSFHWGSVHIEYLTEWEFHV